MRSLQGILIATLSLFCCTTHLVRGQDNKLATIESDSLYFASPALFNCHVQFPAEYNSAKPYPLVISLHGGGGSYETFQRLWKYFEDPQFIMVTPQAPYKWLMGEKIGYDWAAWPTEDLATMQRAIKLTSTYIENLIQTLSARYKINKVYLMGFSQGSIITQIAGINNHQLLAGIIILSGPEVDHPDKPEIVWPSANAVQLANNLKVFIGHGKDDEIVDISLAKKSRIQYEESGYEVSFFEFEGGHEINQEEMNEVEKWLNRVMK
jgi:phospholipase/carboxylesterase